MSTNTIAKPEDLRLGASLPPGDPHGVSVHLPKWADTVGWASREPRVLDAMKTGYPRFFIPRVVDQLAKRLLEINKAGNVWPPERDDIHAGAKLALLFVTLRHATICRRALSNSEIRQQGQSAIEFYSVNWAGQITTVTEQGQDDVVADDSEPNMRIGEERLFLVSYPAELGAKAKSFWQHTGFGISSRRAANWLENAPFLSDSAVPRTKNTPDEISLQVDHARTELKRRIAAGQSVPSEDLLVSEDDVFLYHTGMTAIAEVIDATKPLNSPDSDSSSPVAVFGFPYVDTFKVLSQPLALLPILYKYSDLPTFTTLLSQTSIAHPLSAIITEFTSNPLLQSPPLDTLHTLSLHHNIPLIVDDTVGTHAALHLLPACDIICTSLTKMFSGKCNVMGGAVTLNPHSPFYKPLKQVLENRRHDAERAWYWEDVLVMERNSRDFKQRVDSASWNAQRVVGMLRGSAAVEEVFYPLGGESQGVYDRFRVEGAGYGFLVSVRFVTPEKARVFYDGLDVAKGPSLGTDFTLCCAYTLLAHYKELEWAAEYGVVEDLVRISVGLEEWEWLEERVARALRAAEGCGS